MSTLIAIICLTALAFTGTDVYQYDANGNLIRDGSKCYQYNGANRLGNVTNCAGVIFS
ncbi:MAG TPA: hypothetical protein ACFYEK_17890 [Candidatus Wunengus sp. YC60]|uniref:hypothetical protein n=1 Tax=Candidatus Wunengus sp. YC60 TaxID=3367697 RepID=UPI004026F3F0